ncbi:toll/interleukin-1 receptor domain-containing protein [Achromobacter sp. NPDC058515]|uniref:toll/interleukin-1 receptor domain-containing protein n=1 Tax=Achromobacter sp. NPDC058515 TaxID=3346533 RepID=UPI00364C712B
MPTYFTKSEARNAANTRKRILAKSLGSISVESHDVLREEKLLSEKRDSFDIFLSHSVKDADLVLGMKELLEARGLSVYIDWDTDRQLDRSSVSADTANVLRKRMQQSRSMLYLATAAASSSKWMPWELGFFDGLRGGQVAVLPVLDTATERFSGQEYLELYPKVTKNTYKGTAQQDVFVEGFNQWMTLSSFATGKKDWKDYVT